MSAVALATMVIGGTSTLAAVGGGSALVGGLALAGAGSALENSLSAGSAAKKAAASAAEKSQVNIDQLNAQTKAIATQNAYDSAALEKQLTPEVPALRTAANNAVLGGVGTDPGVALSQSYLTSHLGQPVGSTLNPTLLQAAIAKAQANLDLGGKLPQDVQNLVTRHALSTAGTVAPGQLNLGRDLTTRDLGLTSLDLANQRLQTASQLGGQQMQLGQANNDVAFNNNSANLNIMTLLNQLSNNTFSKNLAAAQYGQSIKQPIVGLDPASAANVAIGNANNQGAAAANQANIYGKQSQNYMNLAGNLGGYALLNYNKGQSNPAASYTAGVSPYSVSTTSGGYTPPNYSGYTTGLMGGY